MGVCENHTPLRSFKFLDQNDKCWFRKHQNLISSHFKKVTEGIDYFLDELDNNICPKVGQKQPKMAKNLYFPKKTNCLKTCLVYLKVVVWYQNVFISLSFCPQIHFDVLNIFLRQKLRNQWGCAIFTPIQNNLVMRPIQNRVNGAIFLP